MEQAMSQIAAITVPLTPPSVNHYVKHTRTGKHYVTQEAKDFKGYISQFSKRQRVRGKAYKLEVWIYLGYKMRGDGDNFFKVVTDGLVEAEVIDTDSKIINWHLYKRRDAVRPRTEIFIEALEG
jgi:crossover junction endodeoxyribonuclease RusA